jgi:putative intracellular protease/amidase/YHS domain-containing protein
MKRREFVQQSVAFGALGAIPAFRLGGPSPATVKAHEEANADARGAVANPLTPPRSGHIPVAFVISDGTVMIDLAGPWQVFQDVWLPARGRTMNEQMPFRLYTVAKSIATIRTSGGMKINPDYTFANAPAPKVIVIPAQDDDSKAVLSWIRTASSHADLTMSVCTGSFILAKTGLLAGKAATTHHSAYRDFAMQFPDIQVKRGVKFVEAGSVATSGGLSSGIDLALRVVARYFGNKAAADTAYNMEYQGQGWMDPGVNAVYLKAAISTDEHPLCPVCSMEVDRATAPSSVYKGKTYYFCSAGHKAAFDAAPEKWL